MDRPGYSNPRRFQLCQTLVGIYLTVTIEDSKKKIDYVKTFDCGKKIEEVESFVYLGSLINIKGSNAQEIRRRMAMGRGAVQNMVSTWKSRGMSL